MAFVYRNHADLHGTEFLFEDVRVQSFRWDIEEFIIAEDTVFQRNKNFLPRHARVDGYSFDPPLTEILHLVLHQGDEWSDNDAQTFFGECRDLECNGFPTPGRH